MKRKYHKLVVLALVTFFVSCNKNIKTVEKNIRSEKNAFEYFKSKAKVTFESQDESASANLNIRMKDGEVVWMSVNKYGKEAARLKMQPDSVFFINKYPNDDRFYSIFLTKEYLEKTGVNLKFDAVQDLFFGVHPLKIEKKDSVSFRDSSIYLIQKRKDVRVETTLDKAYSKLQLAKIISKNQEDTLTIAYNAYEWVGEHYIPTQFVFEASQWQDSVRVKNKASIELSNPDFVSDELSFSFTIPDGYEKR